MPAATGLGGLDGPGGDELDIPERRQIKLQGLWVEFRYFRDVSRGIAWDWMLATRLGNVVSTSVVFPASKISADG